MSETFYSSVERLFADWNYRHPLFFYAFIRALKPQVVVEVGSYRGFTACWMAKALQENNYGKLHCIDNFSLMDHVDRYGDPRTHMESNLKTCGISEWVEIHEGLSSDPAMWPEHVDICYIDGWHSFNQAKSDLQMAVDRGAYVIGLDDTENCVGPRLLVDEHAEAILPQDQWQRLDIHSDNGLTLFLKRQPRRPITCSQEGPEDFLDLRYMTLEQQAQHFTIASAVTGVDYTPLLQSTEHA